MLPIVRLVEGSLDAAVDYLALRACAVRLGNQTLSEKKAANGSDVLSSLGDSLQNNPILGKALLGGGLGAAAGAGSYAFGGEKDETGRPRAGGLWSRLLTGGLAGATLGGGLGAAQHLWPGGVGGVGGTGSESGTGGGKGGSGVFELDGQKMRLDPAALQANPKLLEQTQALSSPGHLHESLPGQVTSFLFNNPLAPSTTPWLLPTALADTALHSEGLRLGQRNWFKPAGKALGGLGKGLGWLHSGLGSSLESAGQAVTGAGQKLSNRGWFPGRIDAGQSRNRKHMSAGIDAAVNDSHPVGKTVRESLERLRADEPVRHTMHGPDQGTRVERGGKVIDQLAADPTAQTVVDNPVEKEVPGPMKVVEKTVASGPKAGTTSKKQRSTVKTTVNEPQHITSEIRQNLARLGNADGPVMRDGPLGGDRVLAEGGPFKGVRGWKRLGLYAGVPAAEWAIRNYARDVGKTRSLAELIEESRARGHLRPAE